MKRLTSLAGAAATCAALFLGASCNIHDNVINIPNATNAVYSFLVTAADDGKKFRVQLSYPGTTNRLYGPDRAPWK